MRRYRIVTSDLDGTLLNSKSEISPENLWAIDELVNKGIDFVPATGRSLSELPKKLLDDPAVRYIIYSNGAVVLDRQTNTRIQTCIPSEVKQQMLDILYGYETHISIRLGGNCYVDAQYASEEYFDYYNVCEDHRNIVRDLAILVDDFKDFCYNAEDIEVVSVFFHKYEEKLACIEQMRQLGVLRCTGVSNYNLELLNVSAGKGIALRSLAGMLGADCADTISIGDSDNDESILRAAGLGLAVSNACDALKAAADEVICSNEEHVAAYVLSHYF